jgi:hypothetical protein
MNAESGEERTLLSRSSAKDTLRPSRTGYISDTNIERAWTAKTTGSFGAEAGSERTGALPAWFEAYTSYTTIQLMSRPLVLATNGPNHRC